VVGSDYNSLNDFLEAYKRGDGPLNVADVLARVYSINQLRSVAQSLGIKPQTQAVPSPGEEGEGETSRGILRRYEYAKAFADLLEPLEISRAFSFYDHDFHFPIVSYFRLTDLHTFDFILELLQTNHEMGTGDFKRYLTVLCNRKVRHVHWNRCESMELKELYHSCFHVIG
jgi:hypothetical protein